MLDYVLRGNVQFDVLIVGAGHGGAHTAIALRQLGFSGTVAVVGEDPHLPYERPPLSKEYLSGNKGFDRLLIRPELFWVERQVDFFLGMRVISVDPRDHKVILQNGDGLVYKQLIWAAGGSARPIACEGAHLLGVHTIRSRQDADQLVGELSTHETVTIIGGGYIGLEAAAVLRKLGKRVVLLEALPRVLARVAGEELSWFFEREHRAQGVDIRLNQRIACLEGVEGRVSGVRFSDGSVLSASVVIVGIGIKPSVEPLASAGADCPNGVAVDQHCRTNLPDVFAIGDCALHSNVFAHGSPIRLESVQNAHDQAMTVARFIMGQPQPYEAIPWFWSHQYDLKLQTIGLSIGYNDTVVRGDPQTRSFSVVYLRDGQVVALDCVNSVHDYVYGRALILSTARPTRAQLADSSFSLKSLV
jgi:3-phenylpropionate/trans-cinnamate dioxygenase ferredoxin reductase subunit